MRQTTISELIGTEHARRTDPTSSHQAAAQLSSKHTMMRTLLNVFNAHAEAGLTAEEACALAGYGPGDGAWKRVSDLKRQGLIVGTDRERVTASHRMAQVLTITDKGRGAL